MVFAVLPEHTGAEARIFIELGLGSFQVKDTPGVSLCVCVNPALQPQSCFCRRRRPSCDLCKLYFLLRRVLLWRCFTAS